MPHRLRPPAVRHMDCRIPQTCIARREPHYSSTATPSAQRSASNTEAYRHKLVSFSFPQSLHYIKKAQGCAEGRGLVPLCGFLTFQCDLPSAGFRSPCGIQQGAAIYAAIRPGPPQPMRLLFPHTKFRKYLINKVFPK